MRGYWNLSLGHLKLIKIKKEKSAVNQYRLNVVRLTTTVNLSYEDSVQISIIAHVRDMRAGESPNSITIKVG